MLEMWRGGLTRGRAQGITRLRQGGRAAVLWSMRITVAAVASYVVASQLFAGPEPLLAPLTAMLVVQVTPVSLLASGLDRVVSVVAGVTLAVAFSELFPLEWWSLGLLIFVSITIGQVLRLRSNLIEVAISGMLVLGVGSLAAESAAWQRIAETLVGAAVGIAANLLFPPRVGTRDAGRAIDDLADSVSELLTRAADELADLTARDADLRGAAKAWLGDARRITHDIPRAGAALLHAEQGRRLNVRAVGKPNPGPGLRQGLEALEHSAVAIRSMFRAVVDAAEDPTWRDDETTGPLAEALVETFRQMAAVIDAFGQLVDDESDPANPVTDRDVDALRRSLESLDQGRARFEALLSAGSPPGMLELQAAVLSTIKRLMSETSLNERLRRQIGLVGGARLRRRSTRPGRRRPGPAGRPPAPHPSSFLPSGDGPDDETQPLPRLPDDGEDRR